MLLSLLTGLIVDKYIERLKFLLSVYLNKLRFPERTQSYSKEVGGMSSHRVCSAMAFPFFSSKLKGVRDFSMSHIRIFSFYLQTQAFLWSNIRQFRNCNQLIDQSLPSRTDLD